MAVKEYWIQIENRPWDACPNNIDRMHGDDIEHVLGTPPITVTLTSPETGVTKDREMYLPVNKQTQAGAGEAEKWTVIDALILRRYTEDWQTPDDRKVNPWDLNEPDPTDNGTMGTIPGPTLECNVGDQIIVHFRNKDFRQGVDITGRTHSLHPHGIAFAPYFDGAFPLSPPDPGQPIPSAEEAAWKAIGVMGVRKQGDRVPPGCTFTYTWDTLGWPTTAGVWHYHDHSICDHHNTRLGALGFLVIHNPDDPDDVIEQDLPQGQPNGQLTRLDPSVSFDIDLTLLPHQLEDLRRVDPQEEEETEPAERDEAEQHITSDFVLESGPFVLEVAQDLQSISRASVRKYIDPPRQLQILQYYHELPGAEMTINGRRFLGNTPTVIAGVESKMRFGLVGMNMKDFHTFHLHGHRWVVPGPQGTDPGTIQNSPQVQAVSQFEDTRALGPANSFNFTINQGSFMGAHPQGIGEWHMHCHVLDHMAMGMMGSLLVITGDHMVTPLAQGQHCHAEGTVVRIKNTAFNPPDITVAPGTTVTWVNDDPIDHTVTSTTPPGLFDETLEPGESFSFRFDQPGTFAYHCTIHPEMTGTVTVSGAALGTIVTIKNIAFNPRNLGELIPVAPGTTVTWVNEDDVDHTVTSTTPPGLFDETLEPQDRFSFTFNQPGNYAYLCTKHDGMTGSVNVGGP